jgi:hypothetical protein
VNKQWLLVFSICLMLSCVAGCHHRAPFEGAIQLPKPSPMPPPMATLYTEEGASQRFEADYQFTITWCADIKCSAAVDGPCTTPKVLQSTPEDHKDGRIYVATCKTKKGAGGKDPAGHYYYAFKESNDQTPPTYGIPDNIQPCNPPCKKPLGQ